MEACRKEGVWKLACPAKRAFSALPLPLSLSSFAGSFRSLAGMGGAAGEAWSRAPGRRNETLDSILDLGFSFSFETCSSDALSFPLPSVGATTAKSIAGTGDLTRDLVAVRMLCSREERRRLNVLGCGSGLAEDDNWDDDGRREEEASGGGSGGLTSVRL